MSAHIHITADDFGLCPSVNRGIVQLARQGRIDAVSVMVHPSACLEGLDLLVRTDVRLGLHWTFVEETGLTGCLPTDHRDVVRHCLHDPRWIARASDEAAAQLGRYRALGLPLSFINSHQHVHLMPPLWWTLRTLVPPSVPVRGVSRATVGWGKQALVHASSSVSLARTRRPLIAPLGLDASGRLSVDAVRRAVRAWKGGLAEIVTHPAAGPVPGYEHWGFRWREEYDLLAAGAFDAILGRPCPV